jgi:hypothetical protein
MIDRKMAAAASKNLRGMRMYPDLQTDDGKAIMAAILDRLQEHATDESHASRATAKLRDSADFFPTPYAIIEACEETRQSTAEVASVQCGHCAGTGWELVIRNGAEGVTRCRCGKFPPPADSRVVCA